MKKITLVVLSLFVASPLFALTPQQKILDQKLKQQQNLKAPGMADTYRAPAARK